MVNEIAIAYGIHPSHVARWKAKALARLPEALSDGWQVKAPADLQTEAWLYQEIERLTMEAKYLRKELGLWHWSSVGE